MEQRDEALACCRYEPRPRPSPGISPTPSPHPERPDDTLRVRTSSTTDLDPAHIAHGSSTHRPDLLGARPRSRPPSSPVRSFPSSHRTAPLTGRRSAGDEHSTPARRLLGPYANDSAPEASSPRWSLRRSRRRSNFVLPSISSRQPRSQNASRRSHSPDSGSRGKERRWTRGSDIIPF